MAATADGDRGPSGIAGHWPGSNSRPRGGQSVALHRYMAAELARRLDVPSANGSSLDDVIAHYLEQPDSDRDEVFFAVRQILGAQQWPAPEPLRQLAAIRSFDVFVSISYDGLLEKALDEVRFQGAPRTRSFAYTLLSEPADLPGEYKPVYASNEAPPPEPAVYHICGKLNPARDYAIWEEDFLRFAHRLQSRDFRPQNLFDVLRTRSLLLLGCGFPGWLTRFFLAAAKGEALFSEGSRGLVADSSCENDPSLVLFLERRRTGVFTEGGATSFIEELHRRWMESHPASPPSDAAPQTDTAAEPPAALAPDAVFISYASEDRDAAIAIRDVLQKRRARCLVRPAKPGPGRRVPRQDTFQHRAVLVFSAGGFPEHRQRPPAVFLSRVEQGFRRGSVPQPRRAVHRPGGDRRHAAGRTAPARGLSRAPLAAASERRAPG